jgi:predicted transcriptional regulator
MSAPPSIPWKVVRQQLLDENPDLAREIEEIMPEYELIKQLIRARTDQKISQSELAKKIGTRQGNISRLEHGQCNPSIGFLRRVAKGLGKDLHISIG